MGELHTGLRHPLSGADPDPYFDLHALPMNTNKKKRAIVCTWHSITRLNL